MTSSLTSFLAALMISQNFRNYARANALPKKERLFVITIYFSVFLFSIGLILHGEYITKWIWHLFLVTLTGYCLTQKDLRVNRIAIWAFAPFVITLLFSDWVVLINTPFFKKWEQYTNSAVTISFIWMAAILLMQNRQNKAAEKERIKRQQEDEMNRAIAIRKVELEGLVAERTAALTQQKEELEHTLKELRNTQVQLIQSEKMASLGELTAGIAHEIQNPLNFVNNFSEVNKELLAEMKEAIEKESFEEVKAIANDVISNQEKINFHGKRADAIVKGMLQHSRSSSGKKEPVAINALADEYLRLAYHGLRAKDKSFNATMKTDYDESIGEINIIPQDMGRVILNLITNAFYSVTQKKSSAVATGQQYEPTVSVSTKKFNNTVEIKVADNGNGIPQKALDKIFQPFFTTKPTGQGTGLGLSMSYDIVTKGHGGELKVENIEGQGATFIIILPI